MTSPLDVGKGRLGEEDMLLVAKSLSRIVARLLALVVGGVGSEFNPMPVLVSF